MAFDIEGAAITSYNRRMPIKPSIVDGAQFRRPLFQRNGRNVNARSGGAHIAETNPETDLDKLSPEVRKKIEEQRRKVHSDRSGMGSAHIFTVVDENGKKRTIIDL